MSIRDGWRNRGLGAAMLQLLIDWAKSNETLEVITLTVFADNTRAIHLYEKLGFTHDGRGRRQAKRERGGYVDVLRMSLWVGANETAG